MTDRLRFIAFVKGCSREKHSIRIPIPNGKCAKEVVLLMIKRTKGAIKIFVENFDTSIYADKEIFRALKSRSYKVFEGKSIEGMPPGHFAIFGDEAYIYQKGRGDGFKGTSNFYDREIVAGMEVSWKILTMSDSDIEKCSHEWEEHGCAEPVLEFFVCIKCGAEKTITQKAEGISEENNGR